jgi:hypothetical protein
VSAGEYLELEGTCGRTCPECRVTINVTRPPRRLSSTSSRTARRHLGAELKRQVLWDALCPDCREWWNITIERCESGISTARRGR